MPRIMLTYSEITAKPTRLSRTRAMFLTLWSSGTGSTKCAADHRQQADHEQEAADHQREQARSAVAELADLVLGQGNAAEQQGDRHEEDAPHDVAVLKVIHGRGLQAEAGRARSMDGSRGVIEVVSKGGCGLRGRGPAVGAMVEIEPSNWLSFWRRGL